MKNFLKHILFILVCCLFSATPAMAETVKHTDFYLQTGSTQAPSTFTEDGNYYAVRFRQGTDVYYVSLEGGLIKRDNHNPAEGKTFPANGAWKINQIGSVTTLVSGMTLFGFDADYEAFGVDVANFGTLPRQRRDNQITGTPSSFKCYGVAKNVSDNNVKFEPGSEGSFSLEKLDVVTTDVNTIETVDTAALGINIDLIDYGPEEELDDPRNNFMSYGVLSTGYPNGDFAENQSGIWFTNMGTLARDHVNPSDYKNVYRLFRQTENIVPNMKDNPIIRGLFTREGLDQYTDGNSRIFQNLSGLFYEENGYLTYDSDKHYAYFAGDGSGRPELMEIYQNNETRFHFPEENEIRVYERTFESSGGDVLNRWIGFFPFNPYDSTLINTKNYKSGYDHHFGMHVNTDFVLEGDRLLEGNPIIFDFSGDDDLWVYIDDQLVLDLGGIHQKVRGYINFTEGYVEAGNSQIDYNILDREQINAVMSTGGSYEEGHVIRQLPPLENGTHSIDIYYMERGGTYSNLRMRMNLPLYTPDYVKTVNDYQDIRAKIRKVDAETNEPLKGAEFELRKQDNDSGTETFIGTYTSNENGIVLFKNLAPGRYVARETKPPKYYQIPNAAQEYVFDIAEGGLVPDSREITAETDQDIEYGNSFVMLNVYESDEVTPLEGATFVLYHQEGAEPDPETDKIIERYYRGRTRME